MNDTKGLVRPAISLIFAVGLTVFTAVGMIPIQVFVSIATTTIIWWYKNRDKEKADAQKAV